MSQKTSHRGNDGTSSRRKASFVGMWVRNPIKRELLKPTAQNGEVKIIKPANKEIKDA